VPAWREVDVLRVRGGRATAQSDRAAVEEPLEVRLFGEPFAVIMRTPGADRELAAGFLLSEGVLKHADDLGTIAHCRDLVQPGSPGHAGSHQDVAQNVVNVTLAGRSRDDLERILAERRQTTMNSSCGLCGRLTIESLRADLAPLNATAPVANDARVPAAMVSCLPERLRRSQTVFEETGGLHAAGLFTREAALVAVAEDVGRHNAVDKVVGRMLMDDALPLSSCVLFVSGRTSFEIVQKALVAGIPTVASVSAPSSLAIDLAREMGITLVGFVRDAGFNIYAHEERIS
jgi:FdhD protein